MRLAINAIMKIYTIHTSKTTPSLLLAIVARVLGPITTLSLLLNCGEDAGPIYTELTTYARPTGTYTMSLLLNCGEGTMLGLQVHYELIIEGVRPAGTLSQQNCCETYHWNRCQVFVS